MTTEPDREPWDLQAFLRHFNARARESGVRPADAPRLDEADLRRRYEHPIGVLPWKTVRDFAVAEVLLVSRD